MNYMVSVIVPTYNHAKYIRKALDSILMQVVSFPYEILIGDDASCDGTQDILQEYQKKRPDIIRLFLHEKNMGATRNSYELLTNARGRYLATLEGDDYWTDNHKLQLQVSFLEKHPEYIGCTHRFTIVDENDNPLKNQRLSWVRQKKIFTLKDFDGIMMPGQPSTFVRRNIFLDPKYDYSIVYKLHKMIADRTLMMLFLCQGSFFLLNHNMGCYRQVLNSASTNITSQQYLNNKNAIYEDFEMLSKLEESAQNIFNIPIHFNNRKYFIFSRSVLGALWGRNDIFTVRKILTECPSPFKAIIKCPENFMRILLEHFEINMYRKRVSK